MTTWPSLAVTKECHTDQRLEEELQVGSNRKPRSKEVIGHRLTLVKEEEGIEKLGRPVLRIITSITNIHKTRRILTNRPVIMDDCGAQGSRRLERGKMQSRDKFRANMNYLLIPRRHSRKKDNGHFGLNHPQGGLVAN